MAECVIQEKEHCWKGDNPAAQILAKLEQNPLASFEEMEFNSSLRTQPYDYNKALSNLKRGQENSVELKATKPFRLRGSIAKGKGYNTIVLGIANSKLKEIDLTSLTGYMGEIAGLLPNLCRADIQADYKIAEFYREQSLLRVPECFGDFVGYYHLLSPLAYQPYFSREQILAIPAHQVKELKTGWIELISYPEPLSFSNPKSRAAIIEITNYLNAHRRDWASSQTDTSTVSVGQAEREKAAARAGD